MKKIKIEELKPNVSNVALSVVSGLTIVIFAVGMFNSRPAADDYCFGNSVENFGTFGSLGSYIFGWTPTYSSYAYVHFFLAILNSPTSLIIGLIFGNIIFFSLCFYVLVKIGVDRNQVVFVMLTLFLMILVWLSGSYSGQNLLWYSFFWISTLVVHTMPVVFGTWLVVFTNRVNLKIFVVLILILGGMGFAETVGWSVTYLTIVLLQRFYNKQKWNLRLLSASFLLFCVAGISYKMPGTQKRSALMDSIRGHKLEMYFPNLLKSFYEYSTKHATEILSIRGFAAALIAGFLLAVLLQNSEKLKLPQIVGFTFLVGIFQLFTAAMAGVFSYFAPWHGISTSISWAFCCTFVSFRFFEKLLAKKTLKNVDSISLIATILLGAAALVYTNVLVGNIGTRSAIYDVRWREGTNSPVPALDINGQNLVEDTESDWVKNCYSGWRD